MRLFLFNIIFLGVQSLNIETSRRLFTSNIAHIPLFLNKDTGFKKDITTIQLKEKLLDTMQSRNYVQMNKNNIFFYTPVSQVSCFELTKLLLDIDSNSNLFRNEFNQDPPPINLHIQSEGGSVLHALYVVDVIKGLSTPVNTYIDGFAASAATLISLAGKKRYMTKNSLMLIHQLSSSSSGKYNEIEDEMENLDNIMNIVINLYLNNTNIDEFKLKELLKKDIWLDSKTCLNYGLVDKII